MTSEWSKIALRKKDIRDGRCPTRGMDPRAHVAHDFATLGGSRIRDAFCPTRRFVRSEILYCRFKTTGGTVCVSITHSVTHIGHTRGTHGTPGSHRRTSQRHNQTMDSPSRPSSRHAQPRHDPCANPAANSEEAAPCEPDPAPSRSQSACPRACSIKRSAK